MTGRATPNTEQDDLAVLLQRVAEKDKSAFRDLYGATSSRLMALLMKQLGSEQEASDALQLVYMALWKRANRYNPDKGKAMTWMIVVARNTAIDVMRRRRFNLVSDDAVQEMEDGAPSMLEREMLRSTRAVLSEHLETLPEKQKEVLQLHYFEDLTFDEVAVRMNASPNTTRSWGRRGMINLRQKLKGRSLNDFI
ncbi:MAG: sigma-70 family RNA polymerase sigma factor [Pseudomonadota bacterium]